MPVQNHSSCIHQNKYHFQDDECNQMIPFTGAPHSDNWPFLTACFEFQANISCYPTLFTLTLLKPSTALL